MITNVIAVTVFNSRVDSGSRRNKYMPTLIRGVTYVEAKGATVNGNGVWSDSVQYKIRVPIRAKIQDGRTYLPGLEYAKLDDEAARKHWTIQKQDLVVLGDVSDLDDGSAVFEDTLNNYAKEHSLNLIRVTEYADDTMGGSRYTRHWRIGGQ